MGSNIAARRAAKALRRKAIVAQKRKAELAAASLSERVRSAANTPIQHCLVSSELFKDGIGTLILARGNTTVAYAMAIFLVDTLCLGIKDAHFRSADAEEFELFVSLTDETQRLQPIDPAHARKLLRELVRWSSSIGFAPHPDFAAIEPIFGDVNVDACDLTFEFGRNGKPFYIPGPSESAAQIQRRMAILRNRFGDDLDLQVVAA